MKVLFLGDIVGRPARQFLTGFLPGLIGREKFDFVIANGENAAGGSGLTEKVAKELFSSGIDILTTGDHAFKKREIFSLFDRMAIIRPLNYGELAKGKGYIIKEKGGRKIGVINLLGRVFMQPADCPFKAAAAVLDEILKETKSVIVDIHAEATSEKVALGYFLTQKVSAVLGTHTHIPTADARIIDGFTAYITDVGMTGAMDSVLGRRKDDIIARFLTNVPQRFNLAEGDVRAQGVVLNIDEETGRAEDINPVEYRESNQKTVTSKREGNQ